MPKTYTIDKHAVTELFYWIINDGDMQWRNQYDAIVTSLSKKRAKGIFDEALAAKLFCYMVDAYERQYAKEWETKRLSKAERLEVARMLVNDLINNYWE